MQSLLPKGEDLDAEVVDVVAELQKRERVGTGRGRAGPFRRVVAARQRVLPLSEGHGYGGVQLTSALWERRQLITSEKKPKN